MNISIEDIKQNVFLRRSGEGFFFSSRLEYDFEAQGVIKDEMVKLGFLDEDHNLTQEGISVLNFTAFEPKKSKTKEPKKYTILKVKTSMKSEDKVTLIENKTVKELVDYFSYTLEIGHSYNKSIKQNPVTIKSFLSNVNKAFEEKEKFIYSKTYIQLVRI